MVQRPSAAWGARGSGPRRDLLRLAACLSAAADRTAGSLAARLEVRWPPSAAGSRRSAGPRRRGEVPWGSAAPTARLASTSGVALRNLRVVGRPRWVRRHESEPLRLTITFAAPVKTPFRPPTPAISTPIRRRSSGSRIGGQVHPLMKRERLAPFGR